MADKRVNIWYDEEGDYLDVVWGSGNTYFTPTQDAHVMALVDDEGAIQGFKLQDISKIKGKPFEVDLAPAEPKAKAQ